MAEIRKALPYISSLKVTKRPTQNWQPAGYQNQEGQDLYKQITDLPGIECEVTAYVGDIKGPTVPRKFPSRKFFEDALVEATAGGLTEAVTNIQATLARTDIVWCETVLTAGGLPVLQELWADVFSDALDEFPAWAEPAESGNGFDVSVQELQWDAKIPFDGSKSVDLKIGLYIAGHPTPTQHTLSFEDSKTRQQRLANNQTYANRLAALDAELAVLAAGAAKEQKQAERDNYTTIVANNAAVERGLFTDLLSNESVQLSLPALIMAIIGTLYPTLDMEDIQAALEETLTDVMGA